MKKKLLFGLLAVVMCFTLVGCGDDKESTNGGKSGNGGSEQTVSWPSNEYTDLIPKPKGATIYAESEMDNPYYVGHNIDLTDWTIEECKAYAEELKKAGFTTPGVGMNSVVEIDTDTEYSFGAKNSDGIYVSVGSSHNTGRISIQINKNE